MWQIFQCSKYKLEADKPLSTKKEVSHCPRTLALPCTAAHPQPTCARFPASTPESAQERGGRRGPASPQPGPSPSAKGQAGGLELPATQVAHHRAGHTQWKIQGIYRVCSFEEGLIFHLRSVHFEKCKAQLDSWVLREVEEELGTFLGLCRCLSAPGHQRRQGGDCELLSPAGHSLTCARTAGVGASPAQEGAAPGVSFMESWHARVLWMSLKQPRAGIGQWSWWR